MNVKPSIRPAVCLGPLIFRPDKYIDRLGKVMDWEDAPREETIRLIKHTLRGVNILNKALWQAAEELSDFGEGQNEIYTRLFFKAKQELEVYYERWS